MSTSASHTSAAGSAGTGASGAGAGASGAGAGGTASGGTGTTGAGGTSFWTGRSGLVLSLVMAAFGTYMLYGVLTMRVAEDADKPGPGFLPLVIAIASYLLAAALAVAYLRRPEPPVEAGGAVAGGIDEPGASDTDTGSAVASGEPVAPGESVAPGSTPAAGRYRTFSDYTSLAWAIGGFAAFVVLLEPLGWLLTAALLYWCVTRAMGSKRPIFDATVALTVSSIIYLALGVALGLNLPSGILGGL